MPNRRYQKGVRGEYIVRDALRSAGWYVMRSYASKGVCDLMAIHADRDPVMVSVKAGPHGYLPPEERVSLVIAAERYGAEPIYASYDRGRITWYKLLGPRLGEMDAWTPEDEA